MTRWFLPAFSFFSRLTIPSFVFLSGGKMGGNFPNFPKKFGRIEWHRVFFYTSWLGCDNGFVNKFDLFEIWSERSIEVKENNIWMRISFEILFIYLFIIYLIESFVYWNIFLLFLFLLKIFFYRDKCLTSLSVGLFLRFAIFEMIIEFFEGKFLPFLRIKRKHDS